MGEIQVTEQATTAIDVGSWVRVRSNCPLTLPYYARTSIGQVTELEGNTWVVTFLGGRVFPVPAEWLESTPAPTE